MLAMLLNIGALSTHYGTRLAAEALLPVEDNMGLFQKKCKDLQYDFRVLGFLFFNFAYIINSISSLLV